MGLTIDVSPEDARPELRFFSSHGAMSSPTSTVASVERPTGKRCSETGALGDVAVRLEARSDRQ